MLLSEIESRLNEFKSLDGGWLDGDGQAMSHKGLDWLIGAFLKFYPENLPFYTYLYPTESGCVRAEWTIGLWEINLEINSYRKNGEFQAWNIKTDELKEDIFDLSGQNGWSKVVNELSAIWKKTVKEN